MFDHNKQFVIFREKLETAGVTMRVLWTAKRGITGKTPDIAFVSFVGNESPPHVSTAVIIDYGERDGFGLFVNETSHTIDDSVSAIVGKQNRQ